MFDISKFAAERQVPTADRSIETITTEILQMKQDAGNAILGIGQRLIEANLPDVRQGEDPSNQSRQHLLPPASKVQAVRAGNHREYRSA